MADPGPLAHRKLLLGVTGSIAAYKAAEVVRLCKKAGAEVQVLMTEAATRFIPPLTLGTLSERDVLTDLFPAHADGSWTKHVHLGLWADLLVVAPATATTLSKLAAGVCDSMLTATALSARCPVLVCPAMDHDMWLHPATQANLRTLRDYGYHVLEPAHGELASGLVGHGRLPEPTEIVAHLTALLDAHTATRRDLAGQTVLVTAGPTREHLDPVRYLSNGSTGTMGFALAAAAARRGAQVTLVAGPVALETPPGVTRVDVVSADEMHRAALAQAAADIVIATAAVADYAPATSSDRKLKKTDDDLTVHLRRTPDILAALGAQKRPGQRLIGFALETHDGEAHAQAKIQRKHLDAIVLNYANEPGAGFGTGTNRVAVLFADGRRADLPRQDKAALAETLLTTLLA